MQSDKIDGQNTDSDVSFEEMPDFAEGMSFKFSIRKEPSSPLSESVEMERNGDVHGQPALNSATNESGGTDLQIAPGTKAWDAGLHIAANAALKAIKRVYAEKSAAEAAAVETGGNKAVPAGAAKESAGEGESILVLDDEGTCSQMISGPSWAWSDYPDLAYFLRAQKGIFFRNSGVQCTTDLTVRLKGYHFECLRDYEKLDDDLPSAVENMRGFQTLRDRVCKYMTGLNENRAALNREMQPSSPTTHEDNELVLAATEMSLEQTASRKSTRKRRSTDPSQYLQETSSFTERGCARPHLNFYWRPSTPEKRGRKSNQTN